jgi:hypothetical protein
MIVIIRIMARDVKAPTKDVILNTVTSMMDIILPTFGIIVLVPVLQMLSPEVIESVLHIVDRYLIHMALESEQKLE